MQTVTFVDTTVPGLTMPADVTLGCYADTTPAATGFASAIDNCDADPTVIFFDAVNDPDSCPTDFTIIRTWKATDCSGNTTTGQQSITVDCPCATIEVIKYTQGVLNDVGNLHTREWRFTLQECGDDGCQKDDPVVGDDTSPPSTVDFSGLELLPTAGTTIEEYRLCEVLIPVAWTNTWMGDANDDGTAETLIPFVPAVNDDPVVDPPGWSNVFDPMFAPPPAIWTNDERCINFHADSGETEVFQVDNRFPGGEPRTIGYWKNWDSCSGGGQVETAINNCGPTSAERLGGGCALLDDVLQPPGITLGLLAMIADADVFNCDDGTQWAQYILDKRSIDGNNTKRANDAAYGLAAQLLAAIANNSAGAEVCAEAGQAIVHGMLLLNDISFDGMGSYFDKSVDEINGRTKQEASTLAGLLDSYNNGTLCVQ
jgi:hypothetical protein